MQNTDFKTLKEIIDYAYTGSLLLNTSNAQSILSLASLLQLKDVITACSDFIESQLDLENALDIYRFSKHHLCSYLTAKSKEFICHNFTEISRKREFCEFSDVESLCDLMSQDDLDVTSEELLLQTIVDWVEFDFEKRKGLFEIMFAKCVRLNLLDETFLKRFLDKHHHLTVSSNARISVHLRDHNETGHQLRIRAGMTKVQYCFLLLGGNCDLDDGFYVNCFNPFNGEKFFLSRDFLEKSKFLSKGYFHVENPGKTCMCQQIHFKNQFNAYFS